MSVTSGKELTKTLLFVGVAVLTMLTAIKTRPQPDASGDVPSGAVGLPLFADLTDTSSVTGLEVLSFDDELGSLRPFEIQQERDGEWVIPSRQRYPADAQDRVAVAATMFIDLKVLQVREGEHERFGVVEPKFGVTKIGDEGVGTLFKVLGKSEDKSNVPLAELIIGKPVKDLEGQYYVRRPGKSLVYQVEIDPTALSTDFVDWIDRTLLPFSVQDLASLRIRNYATGVEETPEGNKLNLAVNYEVELTPTENSQWELRQYQEFRGGSLAEGELAPGEVLDQERLDELTNALGQVLISNVQRKPEELANKLRAGDMEIVTAESSDSLVRHGFFPYKPSEEPGLLFASQGEIVLNLRSGIRFRLLLGGLAQQANASSSAGSSLNRFVIVVPELHEAAFPKPVLEELPSDDEDITANDRKIAVDRITKLNERKQAEYAEKLQSAQKLVQLLRARYADWYYLVSEDVIRKMRIPRSKLITLSQESLQEGFGIEAFRKLQADGI